MSRVIFNNQPAAPVFDPTRADIACFVGLVRLQSAVTLPASLVQWLTYLGYPAKQIAVTTNIPVMVETYVGFTSIFDDGSAGLGSGTDYLAAAVRSFFAQGGRRCYVVRVDDPVTADDTPQTKAIKLQELLPNSAYMPNDPRTWTGVSNLGVLEDVSFLVTPDLPVLCASEQDGAQGQEPDPYSGPEEFVVCSQADITPRQFATFPAPAPRLKFADFDCWAQSVADILNYLSGGAITNQQHLREIQFVAAFPIPQDLDPATATENPSSTEIAQDIHDMILREMPESVLPIGMVPPGLFVPGAGACSPTNISSSFLQLAYPWLKTSGSGTLLESLESPDGALTGLLARNALTRGTFTSATKVTPAEIYDVFPALPEQEMQTSAEPLTWGQGSPPKALIERFSLFGFTPSGLRLLSDVTAYPQESYRSGPVNRLVAVICRAARLMGQTTVFQSNGPALWGRVQRSLQNLMTRLWNLNALDGASASDAFSVRCDQSTMTQNDLDNGRLIAYVTFTAASTIETISVKLAMETSGTSVQQITANLAEAS